MAEVNLAYHDITPGRATDRFTVDAETFERHVEAAAGRPVRFTFDDGFKSAIELAAPTLERQGLRGVFFVITSDVGKPRCLDAEQIRALRAAGHTIGSHTHSHPRKPYLKDLPDERVRQEWRTSKAILEDILGEPVTSASIPYGLYLPRLAHLAAAEGFDVVYTSEPRTRTQAAGAVTVRGRFGVTAETSVERVAALARLDRRAILAEQSGWAARSAARTALGPLWLTVRGALLSRRHG